jgi:ATP-dependent protease Clp ATPase subunit
MYDAIHCSFCGKPQGSVSNLVLGRKGPSLASICNECLEVCRKILVKSGTEPISDQPANPPKSTTPKTYYRLGSQLPERNQLSCSFCGTSQEKAHRLIGSRPGKPPAYICDKCVARGDAASSARNKSALGSWFARKLGRQDTTIRHIR